jgi:hypothetical protein
MRRIVHKNAAYAPNWHFSQKNEKTGPSYQHSQCALLCAGRKNWFQERCLPAAVSGTRWSATTALIGTGLMGCLEREWKFGHFRPDNVDRTAHVRQQ